MTSGFTVAVVPVTEITLPGMMVIAPVLPSTGERIWVYSTLSSGGLNHWPSVSLDVAFVGSHDRQLIVHDLLGFRIDLQQRLKAFQVTARAVQCGLILCHRALDLGQGCFKSCLGSI